MSLVSFLRRQLLFTPPVPTASFDGHTVIVTGSNVGLGMEAARWTVRLGASKVILACRNLEKGRIAADEIRKSTSCASEVVEVWSLDMNTYSSVKAFADRALAELPRLDNLIANAGLANLSWNVTEDNEETITTNVVSTALLICLLHPKLRQTAKSHSSQTHITVVGSHLYESAKFEERKAPDGQIFAWLNEKEKADLMDRYNTSKLIIMLAVRQLAYLLPIEVNKVVINCIGPGFCRSSLARRVNEKPITRILFGIFTTLFARETEVGSRTLIYGASVGDESHGQFVPDCQITPAAGLTTGEDGMVLQERVWKELSQKLELIVPGVTGFQVSNSHEPNTSPL